MLFDPCSSNCRVVTPPNGANVDIRILWPPRTSRRAKHPSAAGCVYPALEDLKGIVAHRDLSLRRLGLAKGVENRALIDVHIPDLESEYFFWAHAGLQDDRRDVAKRL